MQLLYLLILFVGTAITESNEEYLPSLEGAKVFRLNVDTEENLSAILDFNSQPAGYDIFKYGRSLDSDVELMVTREYLEEFEAFLNERKIEYSTLVENMQEVIDQEAIRQRSAARLINGKISFTSFPRYNTIVEYLREIAAKYSEIASLVELGTSTAGRVIYGLKLSSGGTGKPAILIDGTIHAREWIAATTVVYIINQLVEEASNLDLLDKVDWYIFPVLNPDGYEFTHTTYRLWRKTRSLNRASSCRGTDPNRNFGYYWMLNGASSNPCSETYAGSEAFSEPEAAALRDFVLENANSLKLYLTFHSYGNLMIYPWGYTSDLPDNDPELRALAVAAEAALRQLRGTRYTIGTSTNVLYAAAGGSDDWTKGVGGVELSYTIELPEGGIYGFDIPATEIKIVGQETFLAVRVFGEHIEKQFGARNN